MRLVKLALCCLLVASAFAQHRGGMGGGLGHGGGGHAGFGGSHAGFSGGRGGGFGHGVYGGYGRGFGYGRGVGFHRGFDFDRGFRHRWWGGYWGWPWFWGASYWPWSWDYGLGDSTYDYSYPNAGGYPDAGYSTGPNVTVVYPVAAQPAYPEVLNVPSRPVIHEYRQQEDYGLPQEHNRPILYLIAFKDHIIRAAMAYWAQGDTLHYLDTDHKEMRAPLASIDRDFSAQLNRERHVPFRLE